MIFSSGEEGVGGIVWPKKCRDPRKIIRGKLAKYQRRACGMLWDVDEFLGANAGLVLAEVELEDEGQEIALPEWAGEEVTGDVRYYNSRLAHDPFSAWGKCSR